MREPHAERFIEPEALAAQIPESKDDADDYQKGEPPAIQTRHRDV
jgi:hypothetical protein